MYSYNGERPWPSLYILSMVVLSDSAFLASSDYQFGFKSGLSTTLCTGVLKATVSRYIHRNSNVYIWLFLGCLKGI